MQLTERVYLVGSGAFGHELSHSKDCNVYLIDGGHEIAMVDAGTGIDPERIVVNIQAAGISMNKITKLLLTHPHGDHAAGASYFHERYGMEVVIAAEAAPWLEQGDIEKTSLNAAIRAGVYPEDFQFPPCPVGRSVREGDRIHVGDLELQVIETPGHSRGHISFYFDADRHRSLFSGDVLFALGKIYIQNIWDCSIQDYAFSIAKLNTLQIDRLFPGHGPCVLSRGQEHVERAHQCFERLEIPPNL